MGALDGCPTEIVRSIAGHLDYRELLSLKRASRILYCLVDCPTIRSLRKEMKLSEPIRAKSLETLTEGHILPRNGGICQYCWELLPEWRFDDTQAELIRASRNGHPDYQALAELYCSQCGVMHGRYEPENILRWWNRGGMGAATCYACEFWDFISEACTTCKACHDCCRIANVLRNQGGNMLCEASDRRTCYHRAVLRPFAHQPSKLAEVWLRYQRSGLTRLPSKIQNMIYGQLDYSSALAFRGSCHRFHMSLDVSLDKPTQLKKHRKMCSCTIQLGD